MDRLTVRVAVRPHHVTLKPFFEKFQDNQRHTEPQQDFKQHVHHATPASRRHVLVGVECHGNKVGKHTVDKSHRAV